MSRAIARNTCNQLIKDISGLYESVRESWARFAWETGRRIVEVEQKGEVRAEYKVTACSPCCRESQKNQ